MWRHELPSSVKYSGERGGGALEIGCVTLKIYQFIKQSLITQTSMHLTEAGLKAPLLSRRDGWPLCVKYMPPLQYSTHDAMHCSILACMAIRRKPLESQGQL